MRVLAAAAMLSLTLACPESIEGDRPRQRAGRRRALLLTQVHRLQRTRVPLRRMRVSRGRRGSGRRREVSAPRAGAQRSVPQGFKTATRGALPHHARANCNRPEWAVNAPRSPKLAPENTAGLRL